MPSIPCRSARRVGVWLISAALLGTFANVLQTSQAEDTASLDRGRYLLRIGGCNDCHTPGYMMSEGKVPETKWMLGDRLGWHGPWGTTYAPNLRIYMQGISEDDWVKEARTMQRRPPMPWFNLNIMEEADLRAIHRFVRSLGEPGEPAPAFLPPEQAPHPPFITFPAPGGPDQR